MGTLTAVQVRRVSHSEDLLVAGDYVFFAARPPKVVTETIPLDLPRRPFRRAWRNLFGKQYLGIETKEEVWPRYDRVLNCAPLSSDGGATHNRALATIERHPP